MGVMDTRPPIDVDALLAHEGFVRRLARALVGHGPESDDVVQQTWLAALEHAPRLPGVPRPWIATIVRNVVRQRRRADGRRVRRERIAARPDVAAAPTSPDTVEREALHRRAVLAVNALPDRLRDAVVLRYFDGLPPRRIAARLGIPVETARTRVRRGVAAVRATLDGDRRAWAGVLPLFGSVDPAAAGVRESARHWLPFSIAAAAVALVAIGIGFGPGPSDAGSPSESESPHDPTSRPLVCSIDGSCAPVRAPTALPPAPAPRELDRATISIHEDDQPSRLVAQVTAIATGEGDRVAFELRASAVGARVEGAAGFEGLRGGNRIAAEELDALIARGTLVARIDGGASVVVARPGPAGHVIERTFSDDGRVVHAKAPGRARVLEASFPFTHLANGTHDIEIVADGRVRVRARVVVKGATARITRLTQVTELGVEVGP